MISGHLILINRWSLRYRFIDNGYLTIHSSKLIPSELTSFFRDSNTCGYHALKNAVIGVLAYIHKKEEEEATYPKSLVPNIMEINRIFIVQISTPILQLMRSAHHFWVPFFHWQALLLNKVLTRVSSTKRLDWRKEQGAQVRASAQAKGRKHDAIWNEVGIKHGVMERNYIDYLLVRDSFIRTFNYCFLMGRFA